MLLLCREAFAIAALVCFVSACGGDGGTTDAPWSPDASAPGHDASTPSKGDGSAPDAGGDDDDDDDDAVDAGAPDAHEAPDAPHAGLDPTVAPGGNFDLSIWQLQEPIGSASAPDSPNMVSPKDLMGPNGFHDKYFFTDPQDGAMTFWDPENGVTTPNSNYPRSELREMTADGKAANWLAPGTHTLSATVMATEIPDHTAVGQIHLGTGTPPSTKPLLELFYYKSGKIEMSIEQSPAGGNSKPYPVGTRPLGSKWSYVIGLAGNTISLSIDGGAAQTWQMSSTFNQEGMYFKAGNYDQSSGNDGSVSATVKFYALAVSHAN